MLDNSEVGFQIQVRLRQHGYRYALESIACSHHGTNWLFTDTQSQDILVVRRLSDDTVDVLVHNKDVGKALDISWVEGLFKE